jgi:hypothetical protein
MRFDIGDIVHNKITQEEGRVVRVADISPDVVGVIVSLRLDAQTWQTPTTEPLWLESQVTK